MDEVYIQKKLFDNTVDGTSEKFIFYFNGSVYEFSSMEELLKFRESVSATSGGLSKLTILDNIPLNEITSSGFYSQPNPDYATFGNDYPVENAKGILVVYAQEDSLIQEFIDLDSHAKYTRFLNKNNDTFDATPWITGEASGDIVVNVNKASKTVAGIVKIGDDMIINSDGAISPDFTNINNNITRLNNHVNTINSNIDDINNELAGLTTSIQDINQKNYVQRGDLSSYVRHTDYPTKLKAGVIKVGANLTLSNDGTLSAPEPVTLPEYLKDNYISLTSSVSNETTKNTITATSFQSEFSKGTAKNSITVSAKSGLDFNNSNISTFKLSEKGELIAISDEVLESWRVKLGITEDLDITEEYINNLFV